MKKMMKKIKLVVTKEIRLLQKKQLAHQEMRTKCLPERCEHFLTISLMCGKHCIARIVTQMFDLYVPCLFYLGKSSSYDCAVCTSQHNNGILFWIWCFLGTWLFHQILVFLPYAGIRRSGSWSLGCAVVCPLLPKNIIRVSSVFFMYRIYWSV